MRWLTVFQLRLQSLFRRNRMESGLSQELEFHLAEQTAEYVSQGMSEAEARRAARRDFGPAALLAEQCRDQRRTRWLEDFAADATFAFRTLRHAPGFTTAAILTLALGLGANLAFFTVAYTVLVQPLPYPEPARLIQMEQGIGGVGPTLALREFATTVEYAGYLPDVEVTAQFSGQALRLPSATATANLASVLGVQPSLGRWFTRNEESKGEHRVAVLSHRLWRDRFAADPAILGRRLLLNEESFEIVGVMPPSFTFPSPDSALWVPIRYEPGNAGYLWGASNFLPIGRLRPPATLASAQAELRPVIDRIRPLFPWRMPDAWGASSHLLLHQAALVKDAQPKLIALAAASLLLLLIACGNVANLLLSRWFQRQREFSVRAALGAGRGRLLRQLVTENLLLATAGGASGLAVAWMLLQVLPVLLPGIPRANEFTLSPGLAAAAAGAMFGIFCLLSLGPMFRVRFRQSSSTRVSLGLATLQLALATALLIAAGLMGRTLWQLSTVDAGVSATGLTTGVLAAGPSRCSVPARCQAFLEEVTATLAAVPGVRTVNWSNAAPLSGKISAMSAAIEDHPREPGAPAFVLWNVAATPGYFAALGIPLRAGRAFAPADRDVVVISESTARRFWPGQSPIGKRIRPVTGSQERTVIGVAGDVAHFSLAGFPSWIDGVQYIPFDQNLPRGAEPFQRTFFIESTPLAPAAVENALRQRFPDVVVSGIGSLGGLRRQSIADRSTTAWLLSLLAGLGLLLGAVGVYGMLRQRVARRTREIGIRIALGATSGGIVRLVLREALAVGVAGSALGVLAAFGLARYLRSLLFGVSVHDPLAFLTGPAILILTALVAAAIPGLLAARVDPVRSLRLD